MKIPIIWKNFNKKLLTLFLICKLTINYYQNISKFQSDTHFAVTAHPGHTCKEL